MGGIIDFLKKIGILKAGTKSYKGKDKEIVDDFYDDKEGKDKDECCKGDDKDCKC